MKIAFCGKGGSGKSTLSAGFTHFARSRFRNVIAFDADINRHLGVKLAVESERPDTGGSFEDIFTLVEGDNPFFSALGFYPELGTIPVTEFSKVVRLDPNEPLWQKYATIRDNLFLVRGGTYEEEDFGTSCIHVKLKALEMVVHRLQLAHDEVAVFDVTAGTDPLSTSLTFAFDLHVLVVEPTSKSVAVYDDYRRMLGSLADRLVVVVNKVRSEADEQFVLSKIPQSSILGIMPWCTSLRRAEQDERGAFNEYVEQNLPLWTACVERLQGRPSGRVFELQQLERLYSEACTKWANNFYGTDLLRVFSDSSAGVSQVSV